MSVEDKRKELQHQALLLKAERERCEGAGSGALLALAALFLLSRRRR